MCSLPDFGLVTHESYSHLPWESHSSHLAGAMRDLAVSETLLSSSRGARGSAKPFSAFCLSQTGRKTLEAVLACHPLGADCSAATLGLCPHAGGTGSAHHAPQGATIQEEAPAGTGIERESMSSGEHFAFGKYWQLQCGPLK